MNERSAKRSDNMQQACSIIIVVDPCSNNAETNAVRSGSVNNIVGTMLLTLVARAMFLQPDNNIDQMFLAAQCCNNLINFFACAYFTFRTKYRG